MTQARSIETPDSRSGPSHPLLASILDGVRDAVCVLDREWSYVYVNPQLERLTGIKQEQLLGRSIWDIFPEKIGTEFEAVARRAVLEQQQIIFDSYSPRLGRWYEHRFHPSGPGLLLFTADIDERKRADEHARAGEKHYRHLFDATNDGILIVDDEGRYVDINESYCRILKASRERLIGAHFSEFIPTERLDEATRAFADLKSGRPTPVEFPLRAVDGSLIELEWRSVSHYLPGLSFCICRDLAERRRAAASLRAAEGAVHESEERFRAIFETTPECVKLVASDGTLLQMNSPGFGMVGATCAEDIVGRSVYDLIAPESRTAFIKFNETICSGKKGSLEFDIIRLDGQLRHMESHAAPLRQPDGTIVHLAITHDVTERKEREQLTLLLGAIVDSSSDAIISKDLNAVITSWNSGSERLFGYTSGEVVGKPITILIPPDRIEEEPEILSRLRRGERVEHFETIRKRKDGGLVDVSLTISPVKDARGEIIGASKIARDITERKRQERDLETLNSALTRSNADLQQFAYSASHDLQEPIRSVAICSELMQRQYRGRLDANADHLLGLLAEGAGRMQTLVQDLLTFAQVVDGEDFGAGSVDASESLAKVIDGLRVSIEENSAVISAGPLPRVFVAETHLQQLFQNLLSNSIKYRSEKPPHIQVSARPLEGYYLFSVRDNGIGIEPKHFEQVFGLFKRLHGRREYPGTGLGLAICRRIVEVYGGTISVESEPGQGATFLFTLPDTQRTTGAVESHSRTK